LPQAAARLFNFLEAEREAMVKYSLTILALLISLLTLPTEPLLAFSLEDLRVIKISPADGTAIVKTAERDLWVIKVGSRLGETGKVVEIAPGRVVIESKSSKGNETVIIRIKDGRQKIERIRSIGDERPPPLGAQE
jgi:hypothetical protein